MFCFKCFFFCLFRELNLMLVCKKLMTLQTDQAQKLACLLAKPKMFLCWKRRKWAGLLENIRLEVCIQYGLLRYKIWIYVFFFGHVIFLSRSTAIFFAENSLYIFVFLTLSILKVNFVHQGRWMIHLVISHLRRKKDHVFEKKVFLIN